MVFICIKHESVLYYPFTFFILTKKGTLLSHSGFFFLFTCNSVVKVINTSQSWWIVNVQVERHKGWNFTYSRTPFSVVIVSAPLFLSFTRVKLLLFVCVHWLKTSWTVSLHQQLRTWGASIFLTVSCSIGLFFSVIRRIVSSERKK